MAIGSLGGLAAEAAASFKRLSDIVMAREAEESGLDIPAVCARMRGMLHAMRESVESGLRLDGRSVSGLTGGEARLYDAYLNKSEGLLGSLAARAMAYALAASCVNASMGRIVAAPTAGACGILPGTLLAVQQGRGYCDDEIVSALFCAAGVGQVIAARATLLGAEGGCQAECGSASAMAAAAVCELLGGSPEACCHAAALALKNALGLVCDPVAGLVEVPCVKRNAIFAVHALAAADMALAGIRSAIPVDEVIDAMASVGRAMPAALRETAKGGLAATPTAGEFKDSVQDQQR
jgi:L-serine dehydratase